MSETLEEHIAYLSDAVRLERFEQAIAKTIREGDAVADIGCGVGILGLLCLKAGAARVWGIDRTVAIELARETMERAGHAARYACVRETSRRVALPEPVDCVICDHVGYFGVDYGIVETMGDARRRLLKPGGKVVPARIALFVAGIESSTCREIADAWRSAPVPSEYHWVGEYGANSKHAYKFEPGEIVSGEAELGMIDLREDNPERHSFAVSLTAARDGQLDGLGGWFRCEIADGVWMTNSPLADDRITRSQAFLPFASPLTVRAGDVVAVTVGLHHALGMTNWTATVERTGERARQSTWASTILAPDDRLAAEARVPKLSEVGEARRALLDSVDGRSTRAEIEAAFLRLHPGLFPVAEEITQFVRGELGRSTE